VGGRVIRLSITRISSEDYGIFGQLVIEGGPVGIVTLENHILDIPTGVYPLSWHESPHLNGKVVPMLNNVPNRTFILIHNGNYETSSKGCILVGMCRDGNAIDSSTQALNLVINYLKAVDPSLDDTQISIQ
jgi:hypothetical protein